MCSDSLASQISSNRWAARVLLVSVLLFSSFGFAAESTYSTSDGRHRRAAKVKLRREQLSTEVDEQLTPKDTFSLALVVVRCNERLDWLSSFFEAVPDKFRLTRVHIIEKCRAVKPPKIGRPSETSLDSPGCKNVTEISRIDKALQNGASAKIHARERTGRVPMIPRIEVTCQKNVGMGLYGYVEHILANYNELEDYTFFSAADYEKTYDICDVPQFLDLAQRRGFASVGFHYSKGTTSGRWDPLPSCRGHSPRLAMKFGSAGQTLSISGNNFIASRGAIHHSSLRNYSKLVRCFQTLQPRRRPAGIDEDQWRLMIPGRMENVYWEESGHMFFGMPRQLPAQDITSCKGSRSGEASRSFHASMSVVEQGAVETSKKVERPRPKVIREAHMGQYLVLGVLAYCFYNQVSSILGMASMSA